MPREVYVRSEIEETARGEVEKAHTAIAIDRKQSHGHVREDGLKPARRADHAADRTLAPIRIRSAIFSLHSEKVSYGCIGREKQWPVARSNRHGTAT